MGAHLNRHWDELGGPGTVGCPQRSPRTGPSPTLSGGQRAQVGLGLALAKRALPLTNPWPLSIRWPATIPGLADRGGRGRGICPSSSPPTFCTTSSASATT